MKILLTGAAGFLGSHLSKSLIEKGHHVTGLDDFSTGSMRNIEHLIDNKNFQIIKHDVREPFAAEVDAILNFACPASPIHYQSDPVKTMETNFLGIVNMLHLAKDNSAILIQASTSEIYGDPTVNPQIESYWGNVNPIGIRSCYDEGKRAAETLCFDYMRQYSTDARVVRIFNTYGPNMAIGDGRVVSNFIVQALQGKEITIYGDGSQTRSFCYVSDLINGIEKVLFCDKTIDFPINLGNPKEFSVLELAKIILNITDSRSKIVLKALPLDDPRQRKPDISLARNFLNWEPKTQLKEGIIETLKYFSEILNK